MRYAFSTLAAIALSGCSNMVYNLNNGAAVFTSGNAVATASNGNTTNYSYHGSESITGSGNLVTEDRTLLSPFNAIVASGPVSITLRSGKSQKITADGDSNLLSILKTEVVNGELRIDVVQSFKSQNRFAIELQADGLNKINLSNGATLTKR